MDEYTNYWIEALGINDVYAFLRDDAREAVAEVLSADAGAAALLSADAVRDLEEDYIKKAGAPFTQILIASAREHIRELDIQEYFTMTGGNTEAIDLACLAAGEEILKDKGKALREKYFLVKGFEGSIRSSFISSKKTSRKYVRKYKRIFTEKNCGRKVKVSL